MELFRVSLVNVRCGVYSKVIRLERPDIGGLRDLLVGGHVHVAGTPGGAQQYRVGTRLRLLDLGREFEFMARHHAVIVP